MDDDLNVMINKYFDGELEKSREPELFAALSSNEDARGYFKQLNRIREVVNESEEDFPDELEQRIFYSLSEKETNRKMFSFKDHFFPALSYAAAAVLLILSLFLFTELNSYRSQAEMASERLNAQSQTINLLLNSLPAVQVRTAQEHKVVVRSN